MTVEDPERRASLRTVACLDEESNGYSRRISSSLVADLNKKVAEATPVTFQDVTAYFSQDEWKLLHKWQKELYRNLMKEIHQAMISLGPVIAASVFSLQAEESEDLYFVDNQDMKKRSSEDHVPNVSSMDIFSTSMEESPHPQEPLRTDEGERNNHLSTGFDSVSFDNSFKSEQEDSCMMDDRLLKGADNTTITCTGNEVTKVMVSMSIKEEEVNDLMGYQDPKEIKNIHDNGLSGLAVNRIGPIDRAGREGSTSVSPVFSSLTSESDVHCMDHIDEVCEVLTGVNSDPEDTIPVASCSLNEVAGTYAVDLVDYQGSRTGYGTAARNGNLGKPVKNKNKTRPWVSSLEKEKDNVIQSLHKTEGYINQMWSESDCEMGGKKSQQWQSGCNQQINSKLHHTMTNTQTSEANNQNGKITINDVISSKPDMEQISTSYICPESEQPSVLNRPSDHLGTHEEKGQCACTECGKRFLSMSDLITHKRIHTEEKPFHCVICEKSFKQRGNLHRHQILHTGKNPYQCNICGKSFLGMSNLITHKRVHTGEKPFHCAICAKSFNQRGNLQRHQTLHTGKKPYQCNVCGKSYNIKHNLVGHQKMHTKVQ